MKLTLGITLVLQLFAQVSLAKSPEQYRVAFQSGTTASINYALADDDSIKFVSCESASKCKYVGHEIQLSLVKSKLTAALSAALKTLDGKALLAQPPSEQQIASSKKLFAQENESLQKSRWHEKNSPNKSYWREMSKLHEDSMQFHSKFLDHGRAQQKIDSAIQSLVVALNGSSLTTLKKHSLESIALNTLYEQNILRTSRDQYEHSESDDDSIDMSSRRRASLLRGTDNITQQEYYYNPNETTRFAYRDDIKQEDVYTSSCRTVYYGFDDPVSGEKADSEEVCD